MVLSSAQVVVSGVPVTAWGEPDDLYFSTVARQATTFEPAVALLDRLGDPNAVVLDVGSSIGLVATAAAIINPDGRVVAVEPSPRARASLLLAVEALDNVTVVESAVGATSGRVRFHLDPGGTAWGMISDREPSIEVPVTSIDELVEELGLDRVDIVKIDVEGHEMDVLDGAAQTIERFAPFLVVELNPYCLWRHGRCFPQDLVDRLVAKFDQVDAIGSDGVATDMTKPELRDGMLHHLSTTGTVADLVARFGRPDLSVDFTAVARQAAPMTVPNPDPPAPTEPQLEWNPKADVARVRAALSWRARLALRRLRRR